MGNRPGLIVVTGISSFVGCHVAMRFTRLARRVVGTTSGADLNGIRAERVAAAVRSGVEHMPVDIADLASLRTFVKDIRPEVWVHHAGWATNYASLDYDLDRAHAVNIAPLAVLYPALAEVGCRGVIVTGSDAEYTSGNEPHREEEACLPALPYGLSKLCETIRASQLSTRHALPTRVARLFIPYGTLDAPQKLIPSALEALKKGAPLALTPCEQKRDFLHIDDVSEAYAALVEGLNAPPLFDILNICGGEAVRLKDFLQGLARMLKTDPGLLQFGKKDMRPGEAPICYGDNQKARRLLGWAPRSLDEGLSRLIG